MVVGVLKWGMEELAGEVGCWWGKWGRKVKCGGWWKEEVDGGWVVVRRVVGGGRTPLVMLNCFNPNPRT